MSSYQQKIVNRPDSDNDDAVMNDGDGKNRNKVRFAIGFAGAMCLFLLAALSGSGRNVSVQEMNALNMEMPIEGASLGDDGERTRCYYHSSCKSGHCSSSYFWGGSCVECNEDEDCPGKGESLPGELPVAFCFKAGGDVPPRCSAWKRGEPIDDDGYPVWFDGETEARWIKREVMGEGPVMDQAWHWDLNNQPDGTEFQLTDTHVSIPLNSQTIAAYSRTYHNYDEHETGIVTAAFLANPMSVITPNAVAGMIEKYHTLKYDGTMSTVRADRVLAEVAARSEATQKKSEDVKAERTRAFQMGYALGASGIIVQQIEAAQDQIHLNQIRDHIKMLLKDGTSLESLDSPGWHAHSEEAQQALVDAKTLPSLKSENHCKHFETGSGIKVTDTHLVIPLDAAFVTLSGEMAFSPTYYLGLNAGVNIAKYDASTNTLEFYYQASQQYRGYSDPKVAAEDEPFPSGTWIAPVHPSVPVSTTDGRSDQFYRRDPDLRWTLKFLIYRYLSKPVDYSLFDRDMSVSCPEELLEDLKPVWLEAKLEEENGSGNMMDQISNMKNLFHAAVLGAPCGSSYMKADYGPGTVGFELNEYSVWSHLILEIDTEHTEKMALSDFWNDWDDFFKKSE